MQSNISVSFLEQQQVTKISNAQKANLDNSFILVEK